MYGVCMNNNDIVSISTTNYLWFLDPDIRRRFEKRVYFDLYDKETRYQFIILLN